MNELLHRLSSRDDPLWRAFWLYGIAGNALYIGFYFVWPLNLFHEMGRSDWPGWWVCLSFWLFSICYMTFSFRKGMMAACRAHSSPGLSKIVSIMMAGILCNAFYALFCFIWPFNHLFRDVNSSDWRCWLLCVIFWLLSILYVKVSLTKSSMVTGQAGQSLDLSNIVAVMIASMLYTAGLLLWLCYSFYFVLDSMALSHFLL